MWRIVSFVLAAILFVAGCGKGGRYKYEEETDDTTTATEPPVTPGCECVENAPGTYTDPSLFWRGLFEFVPECAAPTPLQGVEGSLTEPSMLLDFVRECLITASDTCTTEGERCAPLPTEDYSICIHHDGDVGCPSEYNDLRDVVIAAENGRPFTFTLCCKNPPIST